MQIPSQKRCFELIREMEMPGHIVAHSIQVCRVSVAIVDASRTTGVRLDRQLVLASAMLHDITKPRSFSTGEPHAESGARFLAEKGYPEVGDIVRQHVRLDSYFRSDRISEAEVVNYSDKRVLHDRIVSLRERMDYILERYARGDGDRQKWDRLVEMSKRLEDRIFRHLSFAPGEIEAHLAPEPLAAGGVADGAANRNPEQEY
jgi:uncharacterized protein